MTVRWDESLPLHVELARSKEAITLLPMHIFAEQHGLAWDTGDRLNGKKKRETVNETMILPALDSDWFGRQKTS